MTLTRVVNAETLDHLPPDDPAAQASRRDLVRVHRVMGSRGIFSRGWRALLPATPLGKPLRILELGAGDGSLLLGVARDWPRNGPPVQLCLMDRQDIVSPATLAGYSERGWRVDVHQADVLAWASRPDPGTPGERPRERPPRWDLITTSLFLHHFQGAELELLLGAVAARAERFFACEPRRSRLALAASHLVGVLGANAVTRQDAVLSVHAGFRGQEIAAHWPRSSPRWQTREFEAGLFSHGFSAHRDGADR
jgi:hypothetical protein